MTHINIQKRAHPALCSRYRHRARVRTVLAVARVKENTYHVLYDPENPESPPGGWQYSGYLWV
jgi:hypothetical protein